MPSEVDMLRVSKKSFWAKTNTTSSPQNGVKFSKLVCKQSSWYLAQCIRFPGLSDRVSAYEEHGNFVNALCSMSSVKCQDKRIAAGVLPMRYTVGEYD